MNRSLPISFALAALIGSGCSWCGEFRIHHRQKPATVIEPSFSIPAADCGCGAVGGPVVIQSQMIPQMGTAVIPAPTIPSKQMPTANYQPMPVIPQ